MLSLTMVFLEFKVYQGGDFALAQYWGVAQRRRRILTADFAGGTAPEIIFKQDSLFGNPPPGRGEGKGSVVPAQGSIDDPGRAYLISEGIQSFHINQRDEVIDLHGISGALFSDPEYADADFCGRTGPVPQLPGWIFYCKKK